MPRAAGIVAAAKGVIRIRQAMKLVGFSQEEICNMKIYQRVRRQSMRLTVVDSRATATTATVPAVLEVPVRQVNIGSGGTVTSTLSSAERTGDALDTTEESSNSNNTSATNTRMTQFGFSSVAQPACISWSNQPHCCDGIHGFARLVHHTTGWHLGTVCQHATSWCAALAAAKCVQPSPLWRI